MPDPRPIAVLISGSGSNLQALIDAGERGELDCRIRVVVADRPGARGLERARHAGIPTVVVPWEQSDDRVSFTSAICDAATNHGATGLVLAGFMRVLAPNAIERFPNAILNIHPALLPSFPGARAVELALDHGVTLTGVTVHFVDEQVDHGPIIAQQAVPVHPGDDRETLHARIQEVEHRLYPKVVAAFGRGDLTVVGRRVHWADASRALEAV
ncbi:MAG TPA: phosphoribosylglycinamide formyltransferase [Acidimicrobiia bacterium]|nr:phosphoribosylglycinamide formyltransferase [Acidimicrobiia bacterium]